jgi:hypothetical protein
MPKVRDVCRLGSSFQRFSFRRMRHHFVVDDYVELGLHAVEERFGNLRGFPCALLCFLKRTLSDGGAIDCATHGVGSFLFSFFVVIDGFRNPPTERVECFSHGFRFVLGFDLERVVAVVVVVYFVFVHVFGFLSWLDVEGVVLHIAFAKELEDRCIVAVRPIGVGVVEAKMLGVRVCLATGG